METENKKPKRPQVNALYCSAEIADAVNNHPYFNGCVVGADKAAKLLQALDFAFKWEGHTGEGSSTAEVEQLKTDLQEAQKDRDNFKQKYEKEVQDAQEAKTKADNEIQSLKEAKNQLEASGNKKGWEVVRTQIDPAYADVLEEITKRLIARYNLSELEPQVVLITFFMKYYYNQEWEFSGMPFIMKPSEILTIVQQVYPEMTANVLKQALQVKK